MANNKKTEKKEPVGTCDTCNFYMYDDDYECYVCDMDMDEDDYVNFLQGNTRYCPYYQSNDEYRVVRHQM